MTAEFPLKPSDEVAEKPLLTIARLSKQFNDNTDLLRKKFEWFESLLWETKVMIRISVDIGNDHFLCWGPTKVKFDRNGRKRTWALYVDRVEMCVSSINRELMVRAAKGVPALVQKIIETLSDSNRYTEEAVEMLAEAYEELGGDGEKRP